MNEDNITAAYSRLRECATIIAADGGELYDVTVWRDNMLRFYYRDAQTRQTHEMAMVADWIVRGTPQETIQWMRELARGR